MSPNTQTIETNTSAPETPIEPVQHPVEPIPQPVDPGQPPIEQVPAQPDITASLISAHKRKQEAARRKLVANRALIASFFVDEGAADLDRRTSK